MNTTSSHALVQEFQARMQSLLSEIDAIAIPLGDPPTTDAGQALHERAVAQASVAVARLDLKAAVLRDQLIQALVQARHDELQAAKTPTFTDFDLLLHLAGSLTGGTSKANTAKALEARYEAVKSVAQKLSLSP